MKWGCWGHWGHWGCWCCWGHWVCRSFKAWKTTIEDFRTIQAFEFSFIFIFWKKKIWEESWNIILNFCTFSVRGCWGQLMSFFWKLVDETQISKPPEPTRHHNSIKLWIVPPLRADLLVTLQYEIPFIYYKNNTVNTRTSKYCKQSNILFINISTVES